MYTLGFFLPDFTTKQNINILANQFLQVIILFFQIGHDIKIACQLSYRTVLFCINDCKSDWTEVRGRESNQVCNTSYNLFVITQTQAVPVHI